MGSAGCSAAYKIEENGAHPGLTANQIDFTSRSSWIINPRFPDSRIEHFKILKVLFTLFVCPLLGTTAAT